MMTTFSGKWVIDSNLLVYFLDQDSPFYSSTKDLFSYILSGKISATIAQQNILEAERVFVLAYKRDPSIVIRQLEDIIFNFRMDVISPLSDTYGHYHELLLSSGRPVDIFDYYLAATMLDNRVNRILTVNTKDFSKIKEIETVNPFK